MEKIISFAIPCFNSASYMSKCIELLAAVGEEIEVLVIDDGSSKDNTFEIAKKFEEKYPNIVRAIHQENKGHGGAVNTGLANARGKYFKVIDSDDWANTEDVLTLLNHIKNNKIDVDLYVTNYVYEKVYENSSYSVTYEKYLKPETVLTWEETKPFPALSPMLMHSLLYKTSLLREQVKLVLPEHTFYVDNIYAYTPMSEVRSIYYINLDLYHYFIGRADQSVTTTNMFNRYEQQSRVFTCMFKSNSYEKLNSLPKKLRNYLIHDLKQLYAVTAFFIICGKDNKKARKAKWKEMMKEYKKHDKKLHRMLKYSSYITFITWLPWDIKSAIGRFAYRVLAKKLKLGA
jgi:glycosyltransferase involved in cell wall biosynthesis